jgi:hypothetical protein
MDIDAFWITPREEYLRVPTKHISLDCERPELFGMDSAEVEAVVREEERAGREGSSRNDAEVAVH